MLAPSDDFLLRARSALRRAATLVVLLVGWATTIATSPAEDFELVAMGTVDAAPGQVPHVQVTLNAEAAAVADRLDIVVQVRSVEPDVGISIIGDDPALEVQTNPDPSRFVVVVEDVQAFCPDDGACLLGLSVETEAPIEFGVDVEATLTRHADTRLLLAENRAFPAEAAIFVEVE